MDTFPRGRRNFSLNGSGKFRVFYPEFFFFEIQHFCIMGEREKLLESAGALERSFENRIEYFNPLPYGFFYKHTCQNHFIINNFLRNKEEFKQLTIET